MLFVGRGGRGTPTADLRSGRAEAEIKSEATSERRHEFLREIAYKCLVSSYGVCSNYLFVVMVFR